MVEPPVRNSGGETCENRSYRDQVLEVAASGFEPGYHSGAPGDLDREAVIKSLDSFRSLFGADPISMANHYNTDAMYWGNARLSGVRRVLYRAATRGGNPQFFGSEPATVIFGEMSVVSG